MMHRPVAVMLRPALVRLPFRSAAFQRSLESRTGPIVLLPRRGYAGKPGRPRSTVGEPTKTVKRSVKRSAKESATGAAGEKVETKEKAAKKKPAAKKTKVVAKKTKKELTDAQKAAKATKLAKVKLADLKKAALSPPRARKASSAYIQYTGERARSAKSVEEAREIVKDAASAFKTLTPAEVEHYNHLANANNETRRAEYRGWVESHSVEEISIANRARIQLRRTVSKDDKRAMKKWSPIKDERAVKNPVRPYIQFAVNRQASGDFKNIGLPERSKLIAQEWKALSESEKKKYQDLFNKDTDRYTEEFKDTFGHTPAFVNGGHQAQAVAAAA